jgi:arginyl-tRNA synthetase
MDKETWKIRIAEALQTLLRERGGEGAISADQLTAEIPPKPEMGDLGFPLFSFAKIFKQSPQTIAAVAAEKFAGNPNGHVSAEGPYLNVKRNRPKAAEKILAELLDEQNPFGKPKTLQGARIMVEFSSPNTNKPLHLGHLRNDALGESISRILQACGAEVRKVCIINDRGVHICKSMLAYQELGGGQTPESEGVKSDRFVGDWYVAFHRLNQQDPSAELRAHAMLRQWEAGDPQVAALWKQMNHWAVEGIKETYRRTGVSFDQYYFESETYRKGKDEILKGLAQGVFYQAEDGAIWADLTEEQLDKKVLLRNDGTSLYITQDIGTAIFRREDWAFDRLIYVVGSEQQYHFKVLFKVLKKLGFSWAENLFHLSYGMVNLPDGKMKSREGTVVDADDLLDSLKDLALQEIREKDREDALENPEETAEKVALGALHYYLLQVSPVRDMLFNPKESLSFNGNTGPYLQYMGARISSLIRKSGERPGGGALKPELLAGDPEWELLKTLEAYPEAVSAAGAAADPSLVAGYLYELSKGFSRFYHDCPILSAENPDLAASRLSLARGVLRVLREALALICIPFLESM